ncbi:uncharacterized protein LOC125028748 [Penaeus chinensis]|uniref:uncharacterized protein LOC125028748 n=1 Tax=Penaeus chinensis TaxID=139456 RepID=UPI001FB79DA9|nr:uncharacterized protein LOC125028748 [Penaeus chinensis]
MIKEYSDRIADEECRQAIFTMWASINQSLSDGGELLLRAREILLGSNLETLGELESKLFAVGGELEILFNNTWTLAKHIEMLAVSGSDTAPCPVQDMEKLLLNLQIKNEELRAIVIELEVQLSAGSSDESGVLVVFIMRIYMVCRAAQDESIVIYESILIIFSGTTSDTIADEECRQAIFTVWASINQSLSDGGELLLRAREILLGSNLETLGELETKLFAVGGELEILFNNTWTLAKHIEMLAVSGSDTAPCPVQDMEKLLLNLQTKNEELRAIVIELEVQLSAGSSDESGVLVVFIMRIYMVCRTAQDESIVIYESILIIFSGTTSEPYTLPGDTIADEGCRQAIFTVWASINQSLSDGGELLLRAREILLGSNLETLGELETKLFAVGGELEILFNNTWTLAKHIDMLAVSGSDTAPCPVQDMEKLLLNLQIKNEELRAIVIELEVQLSAGSSDESGVLVVFIMRIYMVCRAAQDESIVIYESILIIFSGTTSDTIADEECRQAIFTVWASINQSLSDGGELLLRAREILLGSNLETLGELETKLFAVGGELEILFNNTWTLAKHIEMLAVSGSDTAPCPVQDMEKLLLNLQTKNEELRAIVIELEVQLSAGSSDESGVLVVFIMRIYMVCRTAQDESIVIYESILIIFSGTTSEPYTLPGDTIADEGCRQAIFTVWASINQSLSDGGELLLRAREILLGSNLETLGELETKLFAVGGELEILFNNTWTLAKHIDMLAVSGSDTAPCPVQDMEKLLLNLQTKNEELRAIVIELEVQLSAGSSDESGVLVVFIMRIYMVCRAAQDESIVIYESILIIFSGTTSDTIADEECRQAIFTVWASINQSLSDGGELLLRAREILLGSNLETLGELETKLFAVGGELEILFNNTWTLAKHIEMLAVSGSDTAPCPVQDMEKLLLNLQTKNEELRAIVIELEVQLSAGSSDESGVLVVFIMRIYMVCRTAQDESIVIYESILIIFSGTTSEPYTLPGDTIADEGCRQAIFTVWASINQSLSDGGELLLRAREILLGSNLETLGELETKLFAVGGELEILFNNTWTLAKHIEMLAVSGSDTAPCPVQDMEKLLLNLQTKNEELRAIVIELEAQLSAGSSDESGVLVVFIMRIYMVCRAAQDESIVIYESILIIFSGTTSEPYTLPGDTIADEECRQAIFTVWASINQSLSDGGELLLRAREILLGSNLETLGELETKLFAVGGELEILFNNTWTLAKHIEMLAVSGSDTAPCPVQDMEKLLLNLQTKNEELRAIVIELEVQLSAGSSDESGVLVVFIMRIYMVCRAAQDESIVIYESILIIFSGTTSEPYTLPGDTIADEGCRQAIFTVWASINQSLSDGGELLLRAREILLGSNLETLGELETKLFAVGGELEILFNNTWTLAKHIEMLVVSGSDTAPCPVQDMEKLLLNLQTKNEELRAIVVELEAQLSAGSSDESGVLVVFIMRIYMVCRAAQDESIVIYESILIIFSGTTSDTIADEECRQAIFTMWASINQSLSDGGELLLRAREILLGSNLETLGELETKLFAVGGELEILFNNTWTLAIHIEMLAVSGSDTAPCPVQDMEKLLLNLQTKNEELRAIVIELEAQLSAGSSDESGVLVVFIMRIYMVCRAAQDESIVIYESILIIFSGTTSEPYTLPGDTIADEECRQAIFTMWASINQSLSDGGELLLRAREILLGSNLETLGELESKLFAVGGELEILFNNTWTLAKHIEMLAVSGSDTAPCPVQDMEKLLLNLQIKNEELRAIVIELEVQLSAGSSDESGVLVVFIMRIYMVCRAAQDESIVIYESILIIFSGTTSDTIADEECRQAIFTVWASINQSLSDGGELLLRAREILLGSNLETLGELETKLFAVGGELEILFNNTWTLAKHIEMLAVSGSDTAPCPVQDMEKLLLNLQTKNEELRAIVIELEAQLSAGSSDESGVLVVFIMRIYMVCRAAQDESIVIYESILIIFSGITSEPYTLPGETIADEGCRQAIFTVWASINQSLSDGGELLLRAREILLGSNLETLGELETKLFAVGGELEILFNNTWTLAKHIEMLAVSGSDTAPCPVQDMEKLLLNLQTKNEELRAIVIELEAQLSAGSSDESGVLVVFIMRIYMVCRAAQDESIVIYESILIIFSGITSEPYTLPGETIADEGCRQAIFTVWASINQSLSDGGELLLRAREILLGSNLETLGELETKLFAVGGELEILFNNTWTLAKHIEMLAVSGSDTAPCPVQDMEKLLLNLQTKNEELRAIVIELEAQLSAGSSDESGVLVVFIMRIYMVCRAAQDESIVIYESILIIFSGTTSEPYTLPGDTIADEGCRQAIFTVWASINQSLSDGGELLLRAREILLGSNLETLGELETKLFAVGGELEILFNNTWTLAIHIEMLVVSGSDTAPCPVQDMEKLLLNLQTKNEELRAIVIELEAQLSAGSSDESGVLVVFIMRIYMVCRAAQDESIVIYESILIIFSGTTSEPYTLPGDTIADEGCRQAIFTVWASINQSLSDGGELLLRAREILLGSNLETLGELETKLFAVGGELEILFNNTWTLAKHIEMLVVSGSDTVPCPVQDMEKLLLNLQTKNEELRAIVIELEAQLSAGSSDESGVLVVFIMRIYMVCRAAQDESIVIYESILIIFSGTTSDTIADEECRQAIFTVWASINQSLSDGGELLLRAREILLGSNLETLGELETKLFAVGGELEILFNNTWTLAKHIEMLAVSGSDTAPCPVQDMEKLLLNLQTKNEELRAIVIELEVQLSAGSSDESGVLVVFIMRIYMVCRAAQDESIVIYESILIIFSGTTSEPYTLPGDTIADEGCRQAIFTVWASINQSLSDGGELLLRAREILLGSNLETLGELETKLFAVGGELEILFNNTWTLAKHIEMLAVSGSDTAPCPVQDMEKLLLNLQTKNEELRAIVIELEAQLSAGSSDESGILVVFIIRVYMICKAAQEESIVIYESVLRIFSGTITVETYTLYGETSMYHFLFKL